MFQGASYIALDAKGRLAVPTKHREVLLALAMGQLTLTRHPHGCVMIFPRPEWERFRERIAAMPMDAQWVKRLFLGYASDVELDSTGRVLVPPELRSVAGIAKEVILLGMGGHFELWDKATYLEQEAAQAEKELPEAFKGFSF